MPQRSRLNRLCFGRLCQVSLLGVFLVGLASCGSPPIVMTYPSETLDFQLRNLKMPALYLDAITDLRPAAQREGEGRFFTVTYPKDSAWAVPPTQVYAEALAQDLAQTHLVELVPLHAQADFVLSLDLLSLKCQLKRSPAAYLVTAMTGFGAGMVAGDDASDRVKLGSVAALIAMAAIPVPTNNMAEAEVRMTLKDRSGNILWQKSCLGEVEARDYITVVERNDQGWVNDHLAKAVKRANACLLGQLRQYLLENGRPASE